MELTFRMERSAPCTAEEFLRRDCGLSRRQLSSLKHTPGGITCGGRTLRSIDTVHPGEVVLLHTQDICRIEPNPALQVPLIYEDTDVLVFDKPAGMPVHPSQNHRTDTLGNAFAAAYPELAFRPVCRLDRNTSGLVAAARHPLAAQQLHGRLEKRYLALVCGAPPEEGTVAEPIGRVPGSVIARCISPEGKPAVTHFRVLHRGLYTLLALWLETGRTHQIRVHMASIGCPLAGDDLYGGSTVHLQRHALHCGRLLYPDRSGVLRELTSPLPEDMERLVCI